MTAILSVILAIIGRTKLIFELEPEFDESNSYMKIGRNQSEMTKSELKRLRRFSFVVRFC